VTFAIRNRHRHQAAIYLFKRNHPVNKVMATRILSILDGAADNDGLVQDIAYMEHPIVRFFLDIRDLWT
jgi:hypothetical protein